MFEKPTQEEKEGLYCKDTSIPDELVKEIQRRIFKTKENAFCYALRAIVKSKKDEKEHIGYISGITYSCLQSFYAQLTSIRNYAKKLSEDPDNQESKKELDEEKKGLTSKIKELSEGLDKEYMVMLDLDKFSTRIFLMKLSSLGLCFLSDNRYENLRIRADDLILFHLNSRNFKPEENLKDAERLKGLLQKTIDPKNLIELLQK